MAKTVSDMIRMFENGRYAFSAFLGLTDLSEALSELRSFGNIPYTLWGGTEDAERVVLKIGDEDSLGYSEDFPISIIEVAPKNKKFADELTHRDFLGALINLGIDRSVIGDIFIKENVGYVMALENMSGFICDNLERIKHTSVECHLIDELPAISALEPQEKFIRASSLRLDLIISKTYNLSRTASQELFTTGRVFVNGRMCESVSYIIKENDVVSVRGHGRIKLESIAGANKKGKLGVNVLVYG